MQNVPFAAQQEQVNKFLQANRALGAQMDQMQGTTRIIYDTYDNAGTSYDFFSEVASKQTTASFISGQPATNITDNRFEPGEGMVIKEIGIYNLTASAVSNAPTTINRSAPFGLSLINFYIGNNRVIKDFPLFCTQSISNISNINPISQVVANDESRRTASCRFFTNIVIPPQIQFYLNFKTLFATAESDSQSLRTRIYLKGYGKLFNPRNNY